MAGVRVLQVAFEVGLDVHVHGAERWHFLLLCEPRTVLSEFTHLFGACHVVEFALRIERHRSPVDA
jgi:hypothetical protein